MKVLILNFLAFLFSTEVFANQSFEGQWIATDGKCTVEFSIAHSEKYFKLSERHYICGKAETILPAQEFTLENGNVLYNSEFIGGAYPGIIKYSNTHNNTDPRFSLVIYPNPTGNEEADFLEQYFSSKNQISLQFQGKIKRKE
jgi:hypothetical protein